MGEDSVIVNKLEALLTPTITNQKNYYRQLGLSLFINLIGFINFLGIENQVQVAPVLIRI